MHLDGWPQGSWTACAGMLVFVSIKQRALVIFNQTHVIHLICFKVL